VVCDHTKFESVSFAKIVSVEKIECVVTDGKLDEEIRKEFEDNGIRVVTAKEGLQ
jgi:Transcriptional regulators of sugar metabolism